VVTAFGSDKSNDAVGPELGKLKYIILFVRVYVDLVVLLVNE
jgi:hypothetical protein